MTHVRYEIWEEPSTPRHPWRLQLVNYVANFRTREAAEKYAAKVKEYREKQRIKG